MTKQENNQEKLSNFQDEYNPVMIDDDMLQAKDDNNKVKLEESDSDIIDEKASKEKEDVQLKQEDELVKNTPAKKKDIKVEEKEAEVINIDDNDYILDENGNALNEDGSIFMSKTDIDALEEYQDTIDNSDKYIEKVKKLVNIDIEDDKGNIVEYDDTPEGIAKYLSDVAEIKAEDKAKVIINDRYNKYPLLKQIEQHLRINNGSLEGFQQETDYSKIKLSEDNIQQLKDIAIAGEKARGRTDERALNIVKLAEADDSLIDLAKDNLEYLVNSQKVTQEFRDRQEALIQEQQAKEQAEFWGITTNEEGKVFTLDNPNSVYNIIKEGNLKVEGRDIKLPENIKRRLDGGKVTTVSRDEFFEYVYVPKEVVIDGQPQLATQYMIDQYNSNNKKTVHDFVYDAFNTFVRNDKTQFIEQGIRQEKVREIRKLKTKSSKVADKKKSPSTKLNKGDIVLDFS